MLSELSFCPSEQAELTQPKSVLTQFFQSVPTLGHCYCSSLGFEQGPGWKQKQKILSSWDCEKSGTSVEWEHLAAAAATAA